MGKKPKQGRRAELLRSMQQRLDRYKKALQGDTDALIECCYERGMCSKKEYDEYFKIKERVDGTKEKKRRKA